MFFPCIAFSCGIKTQIIGINILITSFHLLSNFENSTITFFDTIKLLFLCNLFRRIDSMFRRSLSNQVLLFASFTLLPSLPNTPFLTNHFTNTVIPPPSFFPKILLPSPTTNVLGGFEESGFQNIPD